MRIIRFLYNGDGDNNFVHTKTNNEISITKKKIHIILRINTVI